MKKMPYTKAALIVSLCMLILLSVLGTGATIAWFTDVPDTDRNTFHIGMMDMAVSYKNDQVTDYTPMNGDTAVFNDQALYEPGYTQVVYLKIENEGEVAFNYKLSVNMTDYTDGVNVYGESFHLPEYLRFGVVFGETEADLDRTLAQAQAAEELDSFCLDTYSQLDSVTVAAGEVRYAALVVYMPESVDNVANSRGEAPSVTLGVGVYAQQAGTPIA